MDLNKSIYRLELRWKKIVYKDGLCLLNGAYFCGPALTIAQQINSNEYIKLDFFKQYFPSILNVYVAKLSWKDVIYNNNMVLLKDAILQDNNINKVPKLNNTDYILIDTSDHIVEKHGFNLVYTSFVVNESCILYKFGE